MIKNATMDMTNEKMGDANIWYNDGGNTIVRKTRQKLMCCKNDGQRKWKKETELARGYYQTKNSRHRRR